MLPREPGDREEAGKLTRILPVILKEKPVQADVFQRMKLGTSLEQRAYVRDVFWDAGKLNGLGDISIRRMDLLNLFWEPGVTGHSGLAPLFFPRSW